MEVPVATVGFVTRSLASEEVRCVPCASHVLTPARDVQDAGVHADPSVETLKAIQKAVVAAVGAAQ
jgi:hypothetical protein